MTLPSSVRLVEVGPRDGLQGESRVAPIDVRFRLIELLAAAGLKHIEAGSFVPEKIVPQMAGTSALFLQLEDFPGVRFSALTPNLRGLRDAVSSGVREIAVLTAASETFSQRNLNCSIGESLDRARGIAGAACAEGILVRAYISCALGCPYEGSVDIARLVDIADELRKAGCYEISLGDTIGVGTPFSARAMIENVARVVPIERLAGHFHDTYGQALANIFACLEAGLSVFDCAVAGLGGCPFAPGATGNVATEDVVYMLRDSGLQTGVDLDRLLEAGSFICDFLGRRTQSRVAAVYDAKRRGTPRYSTDAVE